MEGVVTPQNWRSKIIRPTSILEVGGFRPTGEIYASRFGEIRAELHGEKWPVKFGKPLWPLCQINLVQAPYKPKILQDLSMLSLFIDEDYIVLEDNVIDTANSPEGHNWWLRTYNCSDELGPVIAPETSSYVRPFECRWQDEIAEDYPTHDTLPIDFDNLGIGDYYDQEDNDVILRTKIGGWPACVQSEPWWLYKQNGQEFEYALQIDSEDKAHWMWGDSGTAYIARNTKNPNRWAIDIQFY